MVSIIIPTYNRANLIKYTLDSVTQLQQRDVDLEVIVVDDGSTDNTWDFVSTNYPHVVLIKNKKKGASSARNSGLAISKGEYVVYLDSDDVIGEGFLKKKVELLNQHLELDACYGEYEYFSSLEDPKPDNLIFKFKYPIIKASEGIRRHLISYLSEKYIPSLALVWRKTILLKSNGHDETLMINQDVDLFLSAIFNGLKIESVIDGTKVYVRNHEADVRIGDTSKGSQKSRQILEHRRTIFKKLTTNNYNAPEYRKALSYFLFSYWRKQRHNDKEVADMYLQLAKEVYWPVETKGGMKFLSAILGPVGAVNLKYFLLRRD